MALYNGLKLILKKKLMKTHMYKKMIVLLLQKLFHQILHYSLLNPNFHRLYIALLLCTYLDHKHPLGEKMTSYDLTTLAQS